MFFSGAGACAGPVFLFLGHQPEHLFQKMLDKFGNLWYNRVVKQKNTAEHEGCRPHAPAQVIMAPTQRTSSAPREYYTLFCKKGQDRISGCRLILRVMFYVGHRVGILRLQDVFCFIKHHFGGIFYALSYLSPQSHQFALFPQDLPRFDANQAQSALPGEHQLHLPV